MKIFIKFFILLNFSYISCSIADIDSDLLLAVKNNDIDSCKTLIQNGANVNSSKDGCTPLHIAVYKNYEEICKLLIKFGADTVAKNRHGNAPLHLAAHHGFDQICILLLKAGKNIDINDIGQCGKTSLIAAIRSNRIAVVDVLLRVRPLEIDLSIKDESGKNAFYYAQCRPEIQALLKAHIEKNSCLIL